MDVISIKNAGSKFGQHHYLWVTSVINRSYVLDVYTMVCFSLWQKYRWKYDTFLNFNSERYKATSKDTKAQEGTKLGTES
jgi:hypothetical protein